MVNIRIDPQILSKKLEDYLRSRGYKVSVNLQEVREVSLALRCTYNNYSFSTAISNEYTYAAITHVIPSGEKDDGLLILGNFTLRLDRLIAQIERMKETHGV